MSLFLKYNLADSGNNNSVLPSVGTLTGVLTAATTATATDLGPGGTYQRSLSFNGSDRQVNFASHPLSGISEYSIVTWASITQTGGSYPMIIGGDSAGVEIRMVATSLIPEFSTSGPVTTSFSGVAMTTGQFVMLSLTYDGSTIRGYTNTTISPATITGISSPTLGSQLRIGTREVGNFRFNGRIAGVQFYNHPLSQDEITALYKEGWPYPTSGVNISGNSNISGILSGNLASFTDGTQTTRWYKSTSPSFSTAASPITGATSSTYSIQEGDVGYYIYKQTSGNNSIGSRTVESSPTYIGGRVIASSQVGVPKNGKITVGYGGRRQSTSDRTSGNSQTVNLFNTNNKYDSRFDEINYYL